MALVGGAGVQLRLLLRLGSLVRVRSIRGRQLARGLVVIGRVQAQRLGAQLRAAARPRAAILHRLLEARRALLAQVAARRLLLLAVQLHLLLALAVRGPARHAQQRPRRLAAVAVGRLLLLLLLAAADHARRDAARLLEAVEDLGHAAVRHLEHAADLAGPRALLRQLDDLLALLHGQRAPVDEDAAELIAPALAPVPQHGHHALRRLARRPEGGVQLVGVALVVLLLDGRLHRVGGHLPLELGLAARHVAGRRVGSGASVAVAWRRRASWLACCGARLAAGWSVGLSLVELVFIRERVEVSG